MDYARWLLPGHVKAGVYVEEQDGIVFLCAANVRISQLEMKRTTLPELWYEADVVSSTGHAPRT